MAVKTNFIRFFIHRMHGFLACFYPCKASVSSKNYFPWARSMIISLTAKHKIGFIDGLCSTGAFWDSGAGAGAGAGLGNF